MKATVLTTALLLPIAAIASDLERAIPDQFIGTWASSPTSCGSDTDDLTVRIDPHHISYWESDGPVKSVVVRGSDEIALISELSGEGETWLATAKFELSSDRARLTDSTTIPGKEIVRHRCPKQSGARSNNSFKPNPLRGSA